jgi:hypothetical protein
MEIGMTIVADLVARSADLKQALVTFALQPRFVQSAAQRFGRSRQGHPRTQPCAKNRGQTK